MVRFAQFVIGPAGCGKSTYCQSLKKFGETKNRSYKIVNLDPLNETENYEPYADIQDLIKMDDLLASDTLLGPNGGLMYCMEHLMRNFGWLEDALGDEEDDYILFDCPGQIELYCQSNIMLKIIKKLQSKCNFVICTTYIMNWKFMVSVKNVVALKQTANIAMLRLQCPHLNVMTIVDRLTKRECKRLHKIGRMTMAELLELYPTHRAGTKLEAFLKAFVSHMDDEPFANNFVMFNRDSDQSISKVQALIDHMIQYTENQEVKMKDFDETEEEEDT